jgi:hypothetical protein
MVKESGANLRARREAATQHEKNIVDMEGHRITAAGKSAEAQDKVVTRQLQTIDMAIQRIKAEGIPGTANESQIDLFASGKAFDPMNPENRATALEGLIRVRNEVARGNSMTPGNESFVARVMGFSQIVADESKAGETTPPTVIPSHVTGVAPAEEAEIRAKQYNNELNYWTDVVMRLLPGHDWSSAQKLAQQYMNKQGQARP